MEVNLKKVSEILKRWLTSFHGIPQETWQKHVLLGIITYFSMTLTYYSFAFDTGFSDKLISSFTYSTVLFLILLSHELGHYIHAREYGVETTLPYFIPLPLLSPFGTLGAYIRMKTLPPDKRALFDISYWGPAMSFFTSLPAIIVGLLLSEKIPLSLSNPGFIVGKNDLVFGSSFLFDTLARIFTSTPDGYTLILHPIAFAGWVGLFVTAINLFPIGQLDGGHIAFVFLGKRQIYIAYVFLGILVFLALYISPGWTFWIFMLIFMGLRHPPLRTASHEFTIDGPRIRKGILASVIFILCFIPEPLKVNARVKPNMPPAHPQMENSFENFHDIDFKYPLRKPIDFVTGDSGWK